MEDYAHALADFVRNHSVWAGPIVLVLAFGESLAFISLLIPAWGALIAIGALIGASGISFWPVWIAGGFSDRCARRCRSRPEYSRCRTGNFRSLISFRR
jgi:hypothetical protein